VRRPVSVEAKCVACHRTFTYLRTNRKRTRCGECTVGNMLLRAEEYRRRNRARTLAVEGVYTNGERKAFVAAENSIARTFQHLDRLPDAMRAQLLGEILFSAVNRLPIDGIDTDTTPRLMRSMGEGDGVPREVHQRDRVGDGSRANPGVIQVRSGDG
jgi:hypothetical protein